jgi:hypothetical protein
MGFLWAFCGVAHGQSLSPMGHEFPIASGAGGDQMNATVCLNGAGGYLAWQDNAVDGKGTGIGSIRLGPDFSESTGIKRINLSLPGDQILPEAAMLNDGGVAFVWASGRGAMAGIYARFRGADGRFTTGEIKVNRGSTIVTNVVPTVSQAYQNGAQIMRQFDLATVTTELRESFRDPGVAVLRDGNVIFVYSCFRKRWDNGQRLVDQTSLVKGRAVVNTVVQPTSAYLNAMQDVFIRPFSPAGTRLGADKPVNEFVTYNQRNPAVAALGNGNMVVVWVSEQQVPMSASQPALVDIKARVFDPLCKPLGPEFRVNGVRGLCGDPGVSALGADSFTVVWSQFELAGSGGWDVYGRVVNGANPAALEAGTPVFRINEYRRGRQSLPQIATLGVNQFVVWTSVGQDGSQEGVFGRLLSRGALAGSEMPINTRTISKQMQPCVAADGAGRFLVVWSSIANGWAGFDLMGRAYASTQPPATLPAPAVTGVDWGSLNVSWTAAPYLTVDRYELFVDGAATPVVLTNTSWLATGFTPVSTHSFRVAYVLSDGQRADPSAPGVGTTPDKVDPLDAAQAAAGTGGSEQGGSGSVGGDGSTTGAPRVDLSVSPVGRRLHWSTQPGGVYQVQGSTDLVSWTTVGTPRTAASAGDALDLTNKQSAVFFRVIRLP